MASRAAIAYAPDVARREQPPVIEPKPVRPVLLCAATGTVFLTIEAYALISWVLSSDFKRTPPGPSHQPAWMNVIIRSWEIGGWFALAAFLWFVLVRPWRRAGHITSDGLFALVFCTIFWQDQGCNWMQPYFLYNANLTNFGNFMTRIPGFSIPNGHKIAFAIFWTPAIYVYLIFGLSITAGWLLSKIRERRPGISNLSLVLLCFAGFFCFDAVLEPLLMALGFVVYPGNVSWLNMWAGHYWQFPIYEALFWGGAWCSWTCIRFFKNDKGQTIAERGIDSVRTTPRRKSVLRFLALAGVCNSVFFCYNLAVPIFVNHQSNWPKDITSRSYFLDGLCGPGTSYACPGEEIPIASNGTAHVTPDGKLVFPGR